MAAVTAFRVGAVWGLSVALVACSGDDHPGPVTVEQALPECPRLDHAPCDTRGAACQQRLLALAGCVYGVATTPQVPVRVVSEQQLIEELNASDQEQSAEETADLAHVERTFVDLRLLQAGELTEGGARSRKSWPTSTGCIKTPNVASRSSIAEPRATTPNRPHFCCTNSCTPSKTPSTV
jgi:hypothetical protein